MGLNRARQPNRPQAGLSGAHALPARRGNQAQGPAPQPYLAPWETDPLSQNAFAQANKTYGNTIAYIGANREGLERHFGYGANGAANPYSLAMQLNRRHEAERRGTLNGAGLNLYSGSTINHLRGADYRYGKDQAGLKEQYEGQYNKLDREEQEAGEAREGAYQEGRKGAIGRLGEEEPPVVPGRGRKKKPPIRPGGNHRPKPKNNGGNKKQRR